ncbi:N-ethylammeline chlorohydrolase [Alsobacter metallidurans]|uniref:N-ethylammeline chlorohydrolase n=1 Tax=Alsobacter metallidurans TaxID=340221 RepID=A0A917MIB1_9HYPH|nr:amidohydrolase family protein [Alsobacter metallidurans]GGH22967.1 N-ethylammeline chlorohydrolase [Alsobacter metallidurans]
MDVALPALIRGAEVFRLENGVVGSQRADILVEGGRIAGIGPDLPAPDGAAIVEGRGRLAMPGLINAHFHSPGNLMRGAVAGLPLEVFMLYEVPPLAAVGDQKRLAYLRTMLGAIEMVKTGVTAVMDDAFHVPIATAEGVDAICEAYRDIGMRARVAIDQPNVVEYAKYPFLEEILPADIKRRMDEAPRQSDAELLDLYAHLIGACDGAADGRIGAALSCSAPQRVTKPYLHALAGLADKHALPFNMHILETKLQRVFGEEKYGRSLVRYAADEGALGRHAVVIHGVWIDDAEMRLIADAGATIAHNPVCNLRLGSGVAPFRAWRDAGCHVCIGTDEIIADDRANIWDAIKAAGLVHTLADADWHTWPTAPEVLEVALAGGARALGWSEIGALRVGAAADIVLVDMETTAFTPLNDLGRQLVYAENGSSVRDVMVAGSWILRDGRLTTVDERALLAEIRDLSRAFGPQREAANAAARELEPYYREMVLRAHGRDVGMRRRLD